MSGRRAHSGPFFQQGLKGGVHRGGTMEIKTLRHKHVISIAEGKMVDLAINHKI